MDSVSGLHEGITVGLVSLGCAKNLVDSQTMMTLLHRSGLRPAPSPEQADIVLINTCCFIRDARRESERVIRQACRLKKKGLCRAVVVAGCLPQRYGSNVHAAFPDVDGFIGVDCLDRVAEVCKRVLREEHGIVEISSSTPHRLFELSTPGVVLSPGPFAYLKIAEGCSHHCSFCVIPRIRGQYRSRAPDRILREAESLLERGFRELNLVAQDSTAYGLDRDDGSSLAFLLRRLGQLGDGFWIRILYGYPSRITDDLLAAMAEVPQVCHYLDVPVQHSHPDLLCAMGRADTVEAVPRLVERIRRVLPDAAIRTTCLVGFPGETVEHFRHLLRFVREMRFDHLGVFVFSPEEGTSAIEMSDRPSAREAGRRRNRLLQIQARIVAEKMGARVGEECEVLLEHKVSGEQGVWEGRSSREAPEVDGMLRVMGVAPDRRPGDFVRARLTGITGQARCRIENTKVSSS
ncbi:MAG: 30S ribosomal protein S12 methylthiotransferase RimO [Kiritimatiellae bacterium]|nr:30S ribosomal protein S12 methylthiotransferase RimO [Kiritimatiellia bacterium]